MSDANRPQPTVSTHATASLRLRPNLLLAIVRVRAAEATLELGVAGAKKRAEDAARRLTRLGATRVEAGEPHGDDHANPDPMAKVQAAMFARHRPSEESTPDRPGVNIALTATWDIADRPVEAVLELVDRVRFEAAADADPVEASESRAVPLPWANPTEQIRTMLAKAAEPPPDDRSPKFLYLARADDEQLAQAAADAYGAARRMAEYLARAAGKQLGELASLSSGPLGTDGRTDLLMAHQRNVALLASSSRTLRDREVVSDDPRSMEASITVHATHRLESLPALRRTSASRIN